MADAAARSPTSPFEIRHAVTIAAPPEAVFDYVTNPKSWPEWLPSSHALECDDRPMGFGDTFHEHWSTRSGPVDLDWLVIACDRPLLWIGLTQTSFMGPVVVHYTFEAVDGGTRFTRILRNPARPKPPTPEMVERVSAEAELGLENIKRIVERR
ncbi:SRPBCC family protein [Rhodopseudomonas sp. BR0G17]|uniref:SRPBCC family protein n=1 Tax=Rhodopseudomonas sp. BR0G17 TaxID=2269368 RepID=UPI0013DEA617|nr:SRPBCC family protein [Rhodopseudomonas sp. BR0G17]NEW98070.1 SRPBCC family protein [Rhodopseudomonas sp. BR0G17]